MRNSRISQRGDVGRFIPSQSAGMAELVDALRSGRSSLRGVGVRFSLPALCDGTRWFPDSTAELATGQADHPGWLANRFQRYLIETRPSSTFTRTPASQVYWAPPRHMELATRDTYLAMIEKSVGSRMFQTLYADINGTRQDILRNGDLSCAFFVSCLLKIFDLVEMPHATVKELERDLLSSGWYESNDDIPGCVLVWEMQSQANDEPHEHTGFYIGNDTAVSNWYQDLHPIKHHITFGETENGSPKRAVRMRYAHEFLHV